MIIKKANGYIIYGEDDMNGNELVIELVEVANKRQGTGTELVKEVIEIARNEGKDLTLCAYPREDTISLENLVAFYEKLGFIVEDDTGEAVLMRFKG